MKPCYSVLTERVLIHSLYECHLVWAAETLRLCVGLCVSWIRGLLISILVVRVYRQGRRALRAQKLEDGPLGGKQQSQ